MPVFLAQAVQQLVREQYIEAISVGAEATWHSAAHAQPNDLEQQTAVV